MGVIYVVQPLNDEVADLLTTIDIDHPNGVPSRNPTVREIVTVIEELPGYTVEYSGGNVGEFWQASVGKLPPPADARLTNLNIHKFQGMDEENEIAFEKGWPELIVDILIRIARHTGPLMLVADTSEYPIVIPGNADRSHILQMWEDTKQEG